MKEGGSGVARPAREEGDAGGPPPRDTYGLLYFSTLVLFHLLGGLYVVGEENVPRAGPVLLVSNHISFLDPPAIGDASPRRVVFMAKAELFRHPLLAFLLRGVDCFPVRRGESDVAAFRTTLARLKEGRVVCIFPEGTRSPDGTLQPPEPGAGVFATRTGAPVVPVYVFGSDRMLDRRGRLHRARVVVAFGPPFTLEKTMDREEAGAALMAAVAATRDRYAGQAGRRLRPGRVPMPPEGRRADA